MKARRGSEREDNEIVPVEVSVCCWYLAFTQRDKQEEEMYAEFALGSSLSLYLRLSVLFWVPL